MLAASKSWREMDLGSDPGHHRHHHSFSLTLQNSGASELKTHPTTDGPWRSDGHGRESDCDVAEAEVPPVIAAAAVVVVVVVLVVAAAVAEVQVAPCGRR